MRRNFQGGQKKFSTARYIMVFNSEAEVNLEWQIPQDLIPQDLELYIK